MDSIVQSPYWTKKPFELSYPSGWSLQSGECYSVGNLVFIQVSLKSSSHITAKEINLPYIVPSGYRPASRIGFAGFNNNTDNSLHGILNGSSIIFFRQETENLDIIEFSVVYFATQ